MSTSRRSGNQEDSVGTGKQCMITLEFIAVESQIIHMTKQEDRIENTDNDFFSERHGER